MKKLITLILGVVLSTGLFAQSSVLLDFDKLKADVDLNEGANADQSKEKNMQNKATLTDYAGAAGSNFAEDTKSKMKISLSPQQWVVELNSSANSINNRVNSKCIEWTSKSKPALVSELDGDSGKDSYTILGIRIRYPEWPHNAWALVKPPFEVPAYADVEDDGGADPKPAKGSKFENGYGVIKNVGIIKSIEISVYGLNHKNRVSVLLKNADNITNEVMFPRDLDFDGWQRITWNNPNYITEAGNRQLFIVPLYPTTIPYIKLTGFKVYRQGEHVGGDFILYIRDVIVKYDKHLVDTDAPIDHEEAWGILQARTDEAKRREETNLGNYQILKYIENQKMNWTNSQ